MKKLIKFLIYPFYRAPNFVVQKGDTQPYLLRWWVIPKNKYFNIYLHKFLNDDDDRALHDHPWWSLSIILKGKYIEHLPGGKVKIFHRGSVIYRPPGYAHRIELFKDAKYVRAPYLDKFHYDDIDEQGYPLEKIRVPRPTWTLFMTGPRKHKWGFHCKDGWVHHENFFINNGCVDEN